MQAWHCDLCGQTWLSEAKPKRCSKCKSSKWDQFVTASPTMAMLKQGPIVERAVQVGLRSGHDTKTCRIYGCLMCKALTA